MKNIYLKGAEELKVIPKAKTLIKNSFNEIKPNKKNIVGTVISFIFGAVTACFMGFSNNTVQIFSEFIEALLNIQLIVFGFVFSIYSIILAFFSDEYIKKIVRVETNKKETYLKTYITYFELVLYLYFVNVAITGAIMIIMMCVPDDFLVCSNHMLNCIVASILILIYNSYSFRVFYELKSTIYNTIALFRTSIAYRLLDFAKEEKNDL